MISIEDSSFRRLSNNVQLLKKGGDFSAQTNRGDWTTVENLHSQAKGREKTRHASFTLDHPNGVQAIYCVLVICCGFLKGLAIFRGHPQTITMVFRMTCFTCLSIYLTSKTNTSLHHGRSLPNQYSAACEVQKWEQTIQNVVCSLTMLLVPSVQM